MCSTRSNIVSVRWTQLFTVLSVMMSIVAAQTNNCVCVPSNYCTNKHFYSGQCVDVDEVCCDLGTGPGVVSDPQGGESLCGSRGKSKQVDPGDVVGWKVIHKLDDNMTSTYFGEFPWMVAILRTQPSGDTQFLCGGSIIYPNMILTTAHTVSNVPADELQVKAGVWNTTSISERSVHQDRSVTKLVVHNEYDRAKTANDFAILVLDSPLAIQENVAPVCLPSAQRPVNRASCVATGWGAKNYGNKDIQSVLKKVDVPLVEFNECQDLLREEPKLGMTFELHNSFLCAGNATVDTCTGDGGGPLMCALEDDPDRFVQIGTTSWGMGCAGDTPGVYSSVEAANQWIQNTAEDNK